jgi:hypothetical protein
VQLGTAYKPPEIFGLAVPKPNVVSEDKSKLPVAVKPKKADDDMSSAEGSEFSYKKNKKHNKMSKKISSAKNIIKKEVEETVSTNVNNIKQTS